jgi:drug/metabolite transporter (DMT)-like permease
LKSWKAELFLFLVTFIWGGTFLFTKVGLEYCPPSLYIIFRFMIAFTISFIVFGKHFKGIKRDTLIHGLILGLLFGGGFILQTYGLKFTSVTKSAFITGLAVPLTPFAYWLVEKKSTKSWQKAGVITATLGLWLFTNPDINNINLGDFLTLLSTFFWAFYITYMDVFTRGRNEFRETAQLVMLQFVGASAISLLSFFFLEYDTLDVVFDMKLIYSLAYNGILASFLLTFIHTGVQRFTTPVKAALIFSMEPVIASFFAMVFFAEVLNQREYLGAAVLLLGVLIAELGATTYKYMKYRKENKAI